MALQIQTLSSLTLIKTHHHNHHLLYKTHHLSPIKPNFTLKSQKSDTDIDTDSSTGGNPSQSPPKKPNSPGQGFGSSNPSSSVSSPSKSTKKQKGGRREKGSVIRRSPVERPVLLSKEEEGKAKEARKNESAFLLAWLGLGGIILVQGILLASSGFLPEQWDRFFVKYVYPSFTPTVGLFVAGTVAYGVLKYLQNEDVKDQK